jgi:hypothetical protein
MQINSLRYQVSKAGNLLFESSEKEGVHDDYLWALALACYAARETPCGSEKMITRHEGALADWSDAVEIVAKHYGTTARKLRGDFCIRLFNTRSGRREFSRLIGKGATYEAPVELAQEAADFASRAVAPQVTSTSTTSTAVTRLSTSTYVTEQAVPAQLSLSQTVAGIIAGIVAIGVVAVLYRRRQVSPRNR